jgi:hypothetical protein
MLRIAMLLLVATTSTAQAEERAVIGPTGFSCGKWTNTLKDRANHERLTQWVLGYLSGVNVHQTGPDFLRDRDADGLKAWIDIYCRRNPLHHVNQAVFELLDVLQAGAPLTPPPIPPPRPR